MPYEGCLPPFVIYMIDSGMIGWTEKNFTRLITAPNIRRKWLKVKGFRVLLRRAGGVEQNGELEN